MSTSDVVVLRVAAGDSFDGDVERMRWLATVVDAPDHSSRRVPAFVSSFIFLALFSSFFSVGGWLSSSVTSLPLRQSLLY